VTPKGGGERGREGRVVLFHVASWRQESRFTESHLRYVLNLDGLSVHFSCTVVSVHSDGSSGGILTIVRRRGRQIFAFDDSYKNTGQNKFIPLFLVMWHTPSTDGRSQQRYFPEIVWNDSGSIEFFFRIPEYVQTLKDSDDSAQSSADFPSSFPLSFLIVRIRGCGQYPKTHSFRAITYASVCRPVSQFILRSWYDNIQLGTNTMVRYRHRWSAGIEILTADTCKWIDLVCPQHVLYYSELRRLNLCKIWGFHGGAYEKCILGYKNPVCTS
jgi:hypothetical protein